jgi:hypothetical protein
MGVRLFLDRELIFRTAPSIYQEKLGYIKKISRISGKITIYQEIFQDIRKNHDISGNFEIYHEISSFIGKTSTLLRSCPTYSCLKASWSAHHDS